MITDGLVSIIMPSFNNEKHIEESIKSVLNQTYTNWELIIIDDNSQDNSNKIIEKFLKNNKKIKLIKLNENKGVDIARNKGIEIAKGEYIAFLDSDDLWKQDKLEKQINFMKENEASFSYSGYDIINEKGEYIKKFIPPSIITYKDLLKTNYIGCLTAIYNVKKLGKLYMPNLKKRQDYALWLIILRIIGQTKGIEEPLATYRLKEKSLSSNKISLIKYNWRVFRKILKFNIFKSFYYLSCNIFFKIKNNKNQIRNLFFVRF